MDQGLHLADARYKKLRNLLAIALGALDSGAGFYHIVWTQVGGNNTWALPSDNSQAPAMWPTLDVRHHFIAPKAMRLTRCHVKGNTAEFGSVNAQAAPVDLRLFLDGVAVGPSLATIPALTATFDIFTSPNIPIPAGSDIQFVFNTVGEGNIGQFLVNVALS
jgi:hypothetical protein